MRTFRWDKLVRDKIPQKIANEGIDVNMSILWDADYIDALIKKVTTEEYQELLFAHQMSDNSEVLHEAADIVTLLTALEKFEINTDTWIIWEIKENLFDILNMYHIDEVLLWEKIKKKNDKAWSFDKRYYIHTLTAYTSNDWVHYRLANPEKYPLIQPNDTNKD